MMNRYRVAGSFIAVAIGGMLLAGCAPTGSGTMEADPGAAVMSAREALYGAAASEDGAIRAQALESLAHAERKAAGDRLVRALNDSAVAVRFVAAMGIGDVRYAPAILPLQQMAADPAIDANVLCGVIYALHRLGDDSQMGLLGQLLYHRSPEVRANAALVMGRMGLPAAIRPLQSRDDIEKNAGVHLQLTQSLALLGQTKSFGLLTAYTRIGQPHERMGAVETLGQTRKMAAKGPLLRVLDTEQPPPLRLAGVRALAQLGDSRGYPLAAEAVTDPVRFTQRSYEQPVVVSDAQKQQIQALASLALGDMKKEPAVDLLLPLLNSPNDTVVVSAARSILLLLADRAAPAAAARVEGASPAPTEATAPATTVTDPGIMKTAPLKE